MFVSLGIRNAWRNRQKSLLIILSMAVASLMLGASISLSHGYPATIDLLQRGFMGADVAVYAPRFAIGQADLGENFTYARLPADDLSALADLDPELYQEGFLTVPGGGQAYMPLAATADRLATSRFVRAVYPYYILPGFWTGGDQAGTPAPLRGRIAFLDRVYFHYQDSVVAGRYLDTTDEGRMVAVVDAGRARQGLPLPGVGSLIAVRVPAVRQDPSGQIYYDYSASQLFTFQVIGHISMPTRQFSYGSGRDTRSVQLYWNTPQIMIPASTWQQIYYQVSGGQRVTQVPEIGVILGDLSQANNVAADLQARLPDKTVVSVPAHIAAAADRGLPEPLDQIPPEYRPRTSPHWQLGIPVDMTSMIMLVVYLTAGLLTATNMLALLTRRRQEMGVLRALGATAGEVVIMIETEVATLSLLGVAIGFGLVRGVAVMTLVSNQVSTVGILMNTLADLGKVLAVTVVSALLFGLFPALRAVRMTPVEVLRRE